MIFKAKSLLNKNGLNPSKKENGWDLMLIMFYGYFGGRDFR